MKDAILYLEDGKVFRGRSLTVSGETIGEVVFNTAMSGYQEVLTDPSYAGQIVVMTYPLIGNYGVNDEDVESSKVHVKGFIAKEFCQHHSNYRATKSLTQYLEDNKVIAMEGFDTRALTRHLRVKGVMRGIISTEDFDEKSLAAKLKAAPDMSNTDWVKTVTSPKPYFFSATGDFQGAPLYTVAAIDCGIKTNILRILAARGCDVHVFPANSTFEQIMAVKPDGLFLSNGPGDPAAVPYVIKTVQQSLGKIPTFGICLGHQILGLALGGKTYKLKFGHHGANHPVRDIVGNRVSITSQNHNYCVDMDSLNADDVEMIDVNLNDRTVEGLKHKKFPVYSIQYHPESCPGPHDAQYLFDPFFESMKEFKKS